MEHTTSQNHVSDDSFVVLEKYGNFENDGKEEEENINQTTPSLEVNVNFQLKLDRQKNEEPISPKLNSSQPICQSKEAQADYCKYSVGKEDISEEFEHINEDDYIGFDKSNQSYGPHQRVSGIEPSDCENGNEDRHSEQHQRKHPQNNDMETKTTNSEGNIPNMSYKIDPAIEGKKDNDRVYNHQDLSKDNDQRTFASGALLEQAHDDQVQKKCQRGYENYTDEQATSNIETEQCEQMAADEFTRHINLNDENENDSDKNVEVTKNVDTTKTQKESLENEEHAYSTLNKSKQQGHNDNLTKSTSEENDKTDEHSDKAILQYSEGENVEQTEISRIRSDQTLNYETMKCSPKRDSQSRLNPHENGEIATLKRVDIQRLKTEKTKSNDNQFHEHTPQDCHSNGDYENTPTLVKNGGLLINVTPSYSNHTFQMSDTIAREEKKESSERVSLDCCTKQDSFNDTTLKESDLVSSVENAEGHKYATSLNDIVKRKLDIGDSEGTNILRETKFLASLETTDTKTKQKSVSVKQKEITDDLQNKIETNKTHVDIKTEHGEVKLIKVGKFYLISINGKKSKLPKSVSQDTDLRLEKIGDYILLSTKTICYKVCIEQNKIVLEYVNNECRPMLESSESRHAEQTLTNEFKLSNGTERETNEESIESSGNISIDVQNNINEQCKFETDKEETFGSRGEITQRETSSNQEMDEKTMQMQDDFKDISLIRVGKFWLISLNGRKSKLPKTINQDPTLRIKVDGEDLLLLSDNCCFKIRQSENKITLNEYKSYFERTSNENISGCAKTDSITGQSFDNYQKDEKCSESSYREFKEHTDATRKGSYEIETEENTRTINDRVCLPYVDRRNVEANLATMDGNSNNGANQHDRSMTDASEIVTDSKQDKYYQYLPDSESKETESQGDLDSLTFRLESMNLKGVKHEQSFEYRMDENVVAKTVYMEFTIEEFIRWVFFLNSPTKRKKCSHIQINQTVIELEIRPELCKVLTPLKSSMQIMTVVHHLKSQVICSTTDVAVHNITNTYGAMSTETLKRITEINEEGILVKTIEESIYCAYLSSFQDKVKTILESIVQEKHVKSIESDADAKKVTCNIALPGHLPWADIFERFDLTNELQQKFQHVFVQIEKQTSGIAVILNGFESDVEQAKHFIQHDFADCIKRHEMKLTIVNTDVFLETNLLSFIKEQLQRTVHLELENKKVVLYYLKDESLSQAVALISSQIVEEEILLTGNRSSEDATSYLSNKYENSKNGCLVLVNRQRTKVTVTGWRLNVFEIVQHIQQQRKEDPECLQSTSTKSKTGFITMESTKTRRLRHLQPVQLWSALFARFNIANVLKKTAKSQDILIFREERKDEFGKQVLELVIEGQEADVDRLMTLFENDFVSKLNKTNLTENMTQVLLHFRMRESVQRQFPDVLFIVNKALVELYAFSNEICQDTANHLRKMFSEDKFILEEQVNKEAVLIDLERFQKEAEGVCLGLDEDDNAIIVSGLKDEVNRVLNELYQVSVSWYSTSKTHIVENREHFSVLQLDSPFLDQLKNAFDVDITYIDETDTQGLLIKGHASKIELCQRKIEDYQLSILTESIETDTTEEAVLTREFQLTLDGFPLCIDLQLEFTSNLFYKDEKREQKVWIFPNGQKLCLLNKDVIAPDTFVDVEVVEAIDQRGRYDSHSTRGKLSVTLHQPFIKKNTDNPFQRTKEIIQEILGEASKTNEEAISFQIPKLKTWNHGNLMKCWMAAFSEYFVAAAKRCSIKFILLCATKIDFSICLHPFKNEMVQLAHEQLHATPKNTRNEEFQIKVVKGKLNEIEADVLVNTTSLNLDLSKGSVSKCILKTAGTQLQTEVKQNYPNGIKPFEIAVTNGHGLSCKAVYHGALQFYDPKLGAELKREFQIFMQNCLMRASRENHLSIAFPAIGTGNLRYPLDFVVNEMFENVKQYKQIHRDTTLVKVLIVVFPGDFNACVKFAERQRLEDVGNAKQKKLTKPKIPCHLNIRVTGHKDNTGKALNMVKKQLKLEAQSNDLKPIAYDDALALPEYHNQPKKQTDITEDPLSEPRHVLDAFKCETVEGLIVKVYKEDILHLPVDCIVNPANGNLCHFAGLAAAIAKAAGKEFIVESNYYVQRIGYVAIGKAVQTTAGNLNYKCIIHAVGPNWNDYIPYTAEDVMACKEDLKQAIIASLDIAAQSGMKTIGIPAVSSALFGVPMELCAMQYVNAVQEFSARQRNSTTLKEVHFVDMDNNVVGIIIQAYTEMLINKVACPWNWKVYVKTEQVAVGERLGNSKQHTNIFASTPCFIENGNTLTCKFTKIHMVTISQEDIFSFKTMDAIVCSEDPSGSATGGVAKTLLRKGGKTYAQEKKQQYRMFKPKTGEVLITGGGETGYKHVMHAIMPHRTHFAADERGRAEWIKALSDMLTTIFDTAEKHSFKTMAMSLLGTGAGNSNPKQCASVLLDCFTSSCIRYRGSPFVLAIVNNDSSRNRIVADLFKQHIIDSQRYLATSTTDESKGYTTSDQGAAGNKLPPLQKEEKTEVMHCAICREHLNHPKTLTCGHTFCTRCFDKTLKIKPVCPSCGTVFGILKGNQPDGDMTIDLIDETLAGYKDCDTIRITYSFEGGKQQQNHPCPGKAYTASEARAYLPNNKEGREVLLLLKLAFERRLTFTFETSSKTGRVGVISWNDIHHKTDKYRNTQFGYPDPKYFNRIKQELAAKGVKAGDSHLDVSLLSKLDRHIKIVIPVKGYRMGGIFGTRV